MQYQIKQMDSPRVGLMASFSRRVVPCDELLEASCPLRVDAFPMRYFVKDIAAPIRAAFEQKLF